MSESRNQAPNKAQHCLSLFELSSEAIHKTLALAHQMKANPANYQQCLAGKSIAMLFEKPSLRTRVSFDVGIHQLGGHAIYLDSKQVGPGARETVTDIANNLACWTQGIVARVYQHDTLTQLAHAKVPVINALCDQHHPCQSLADMLTLQELYGEDLSELSMAYIGDGNNVCQSLMVACAALHVKLYVVTPAAYAPSAEFMAQLDAHHPAHDITLLHDVASLPPVNVVYTDTWVSMGEDLTQSTAKKSALAPFQVNHALMSKLKATHLLHCLPAHRDEEVASTLLDEQLATVLRQAENRMHAQKALLALLLNEDYV